MEQQLLLKLLWIPSEPTRMNMLRMFLQGPGETAGADNNKMSPEAFLKAIAYHAKLVKIIMHVIPDKQEVAQQEMNALLQIAMNARTALVEMHGEKSPVVIQFQDGLSPAFA
jgi:ATP-dependent phosphoenolpyruvate carboxykinase